MLLSRAIQVAVCLRGRLFRDALIACLAAQPEFTIVGHVATYDELLALLGLRHPDIVVLDVDEIARSSPTGLTGLRACAAHTRVIGVYEALTPQAFAAAQAADVNALVPASHGLQALLVILRQQVQVLRSEAVVTHRPDVISDQERQIIALLGAGHTVRRIGEMLDLLPWSVENIKRRIYHKLGANSQSQAVAKATTLGIIGERAAEWDSPAPVLKGAMLALLRGPETETRHSIVVTLLANGLPFVIDETGGDGEAGGWQGWHRGPMLWLLVDPDPADWPGADNRLPIVLVRSQVLGRTEALDALSRGVGSVVAADRAHDILLPALVLAVAGHLCMDPAAVPALVRILRLAPHHPDARLPSLTAREADILRSIALGHTVRQTARHLAISEKTVQNIQARLFLKLGTRNRASALTAAHSLGLLDEVAAAPAEPAGADVTGAPAASRRGRP